MRSIPLAPVVVCNYPATGGTPCTNYASTYQTPTLAGACSSATPVIIPTTTNCSATSDLSGNFVIFVPPGAAYAYYFKYVNTWYGPYSVSSGSGLISLTSGGGLSVGGGTLGLITSCSIYRKIKTNFGES
jgi:hypothetical protein